MKILHKISGKVLFESDSDSMKLTVEAAVKAKVDLRSANLSYADLRSADLSYADLRSANLSYANLRYANLSYADLRYADLSYADLDFSCFPLWCGSFVIKVDMKLVYQLCYHVCRLDNKSKEYTELQGLLKGYANKFHRVGACGKIGEDK